MRTVFCACLLLVASRPAAWAQNEALLLTFPAETAGLSGFRAQWDTPLPGALVFDAVHRSLLVRFPQAAERLADQLNKRYRVQKVELVLPLKEVELYTGSVGYNQRLSFGCDELYKTVPPAWHAVAWALRKPWVADAELGPTFNAYLNGSGYWAKFGAQDEQKDRFPMCFGPAEVSAQHPVGRLDLTALLTEPTYGATLGDRLRRLADCGVLVKKWEVYDFRFRKNGDGAYEWGVATGGRGLLLEPPTLEVTCVPAPQAPAIDKLPPATNPRALAAQLARQRTDGSPTAVMPTPEQFPALLERYALRRPAWMPAWQWERVQELDRLGGGYRFPTDLAAYGKWLDGMLADPPRYWNGWDVPDRLLAWYLYRDALPAPVQDHWRNFWTAWIMPDRKTPELEHPQAIELWYGGKNKYYEETGDWRGNASFFRDGYCYTISTMNFNHTAAMGALLGGHLVGSPDAMADGRYGLEHFPLRLWSWFDGSTQESVDHYYFGLTLSDQKMFADFGPTPLDRMMGQMMLTKSVEELTSSYHPALRRFIASSTRTSTPQYLLVTQDALQHIMHVLSRRGALHDLDNADLPAQAPVIGSDTPPGRIAQQSVTAPWAPEWASYMVDEKPLPYEMTNTYKMWGGHAEHPLWRRTYLGRHYGLASTDAYDSVVPIMGQWRRRDKPVERLQELGTMVMRYGVNTTPLVNATHGWMHPLGAQAALQHRNKLLVVTSPYNNDSVKALAKQGLHSLQSTIGLFNYQQPLTWEIYVDDQPVAQLPVACRQGQRITIHDGVTYLGVIPLPATDLGRTQEVTLGEGTPQEWHGTWQAALVIDSYNLKSEDQVDNPDWATCDQAYGGFVLEFGDESEYGSFAAFRRHMQEAVLDTRWEPEARTCHVTYRSGADLLEMGVKTDYAGGPTPGLFAYRRVNGQWPYLAPGLDRDTTLTQQGRTGRLEKNGAVLTTEPGRMAYLQTEPVTGTCAGYNPLPDPTLWSLEVPGGVTVSADGRLGLARIIVRPRENRLWVDYAVRDDQKTPDMATVLVVRGLQPNPTVERNDQPCRDAKNLTLEGKPALVIPLAPGMNAAAWNAVPRRYARARQVFTLPNRPDPLAYMVQDWQIVGPFDNTGGRGFATAYGPEQDLTKQSYPGQNGQVTWQRLRGPDQPPLGPGAVDLSGRFPVKENVCAYALTRVISDRERAATLFTGSDDTLTVWLNGQQVLAKEVYRAAAPDSERTEVTLNKGVNTILVKVCQGTGGWALYLRLGDEYGLPLTEGVVYGLGQAD